MAGKGSLWLDEGAKSYYKRVEAFLDGEQDDGDELFLKNVLQQVFSDGTCRVCSDKDGSRAIERLLQHSVVDILSLKNLLEAISPDYYTLAKDRCGSHVIEALMKKTVEILTKNEDEALHELFQVLYSNLKEHIAEFIAHAYASHVLSMLLQVLSGLYFGDHVSRSKYSQEFRKAKMGGSSSQHKAELVSSRKSIPVSFNKLLDSIAKKVCKLDGLDILVRHECANPVLQVLLRVLAQRLPERSNKLIRKMVRASQVFGTTLESDSSTTLPGLFTDVVGSHLIETMLEVASEELQAHIYDNCFKGKVMRFAIHPIANYPLQQLIISATPAQVSMLVDELLSLEDVLFAGHTGVVVKLAQALLARPDKQPVFLDALLQAFHVEAQPKLCAPLFLSLTAYEVYFSPSKDNDGKEEQEEAQSDAAPPKSITTLGSLLVQALLKFDSPKKVANSLLKMSLDEVVRLSCDPSGSHVIDAFMSSPTVSRKLKAKLTEKLKMSLSQLCKDKHGSRVVDVVWRQCEVGDKEALIQELLSHEEELMDDFFGKIVLRNCNIAHYKTKQAAWKVGQLAADKKRELFKDIITADDGKHVSAKRKHKKKVPLFDSDGEEKLPQKKARKQ